MRWVAISRSPRPNQAASAPYTASSSLTRQVSLDRPHPQPVQRDVVTGVDDGGDLGVGVSDTDATQEPGPPDTSGQDGYLHRLTLCNGPGPRWPHPVLVRH